MSSENEYVGGKVDEIRKNVLIEEGANHYKAKQYEEALADYESAIRLGPRDAAAFIGKGDSLRHLIRYEEAIEAYKEAIDLDADNVSAYIGKCYALMRLDFNEAALSMYQKAVELDPVNPSAYHCKGHILRRKNRSGEALKAYEEAIRLARESDNIAIYYNSKAVILHYDLKQYESALGIYNIAAQIDPNLDYVIDNRNRLLNDLISYYDILCNYSGAQATGKG